MVFIATCTIDKSPLGPTADRSHFVGQGEDYHVYSQVIKSMFLDENTKLVVIRDSTVTYSLSNQIDYLMEHVPQLDSTLLADYQLHNSRRTALLRIPGLGIECHLLSDAELDDIFNNGWWPEFYQRFPHSGGYITFSSIGWSGDRETAILYASRVRGRLAGAGYLVLLQKTQHWHIISSLLLWIS